MPMWIITHLMALMLGGLLVGMSVKGNADMNLSIGASGAQMQVKQVQQVSGAVRALSSELRQCLSAK